MQSWREAKILTPRSRGSTETVRRTELGNSLALGLQRGVNVRRLPLAAG